MFDFVVKHPVSFALYICLLLFLTAGIFFNASVNDYEVTYFILTAHIALLSDKFIPKISLILLLLTGFVSYQIFTLSAQALLWSAYIVLGIFVFFNKHKPHIFTFGVIAAASMLHLYYIQNTPIDVRQHDLNGILLYMKHITLGGINWRYFDPWYMYYFFHQPLHFIINGYLLGAETLLWHSNTLAVEGLQYVSLFYTTTSMIVALGILKELQFSKKSLVAALVLFAFNPTLTLFSGFISDDTPTLLWSLLVIYAILLWYNKERTQYIVFAACAFGFGVLTKLSVLMLVPALTFLFAYKLYVSVDKKKTLQQICYFIIIAVPLSLVWIMRNHIFYDMAFYNVPDTSPAGQNFKYMALWERLFDFSMLNSPFLNAPKTAEPNVILALVKTELFGEWDLSISHLSIYLPGLLLYVVNLGIKVTTAIGVLYKIQKNIPRITSPLLCFFIIIYLTLWGYVIKYSVDYPYICSSNFRLFAQLIITEVVILTSLTERFKKYTAFCALAALYAVLSLIIYTAGI